MDITHVANPVRVNALQIASIFPADGDGHAGTLVLCDNGDEVRLTPEMTSRHTPSIGDYVVTQEDGYVYLNPKDVFERKYRRPDLDPVRRPFGQDFSYALDALKAGKRVARAGWNGKGMFVYLVPPASYPVQTGAAKAHFGEGSMVPYNAYLAIKTVHETVSTWVPSVNDCLANDWQLVDASQ